MSADQAGGAGAEGGRRSGLEVFEANRNRLFGVAYGMLGEVMEAEDLVQETWIRWSAADQASVTNPGGYLTTIVTRLAIDRLRSARHQREQYVGPWLPDPVVTEHRLLAGPEGPDELVATAEQLSMALLVALERLNPVERAVLLLRDVFDLDYSEVAGIVDRSSANCRQIARRARDRVGDTSRSFPATAEREEELVSAFMAAMSTGDLDGLTSLLAEDVILWGDGGGHARAARKPVLGLHRVSRFLIGVRSQVKPGTRFGLTRANGDPALYLSVDDRPFVLMILQIDHDRIVTIRNHLNPARLAQLPPIATPFPAVMEL